MSLISLIVVSLSIRNYRADIVSFSMGVIKQEKIAHLVSCKISEIWFMTSQSVRFHQRHHNHIYLISSEISWNLPNNTTISDISLKATVYYWVLKRFQHETRCAILYLSDITSALHKAMWLPCWDMYRLGYQTDQVYHNKYASRKP